MTQRCQESQHYFCCRNNNGSYFPLQLTTRTMLMFLLVYHCVLSSTTLAFFGTNHRSRPLICRPKTTCTNYIVKDRMARPTTLYAAVSGASSSRTNILLPLLDLLEDKEMTDKENDNHYENVLMPLPSLHLPDQLATPFLYGMQITTPLHKAILEEAMTTKIVSLDNDNDKNRQLPNQSQLRRHTERPMYGHLIWKDTTSDSLIGAIGCTAEILINTPTQKFYEKANNEGELLALQNIDQIKEGDTKVGDEDDEDESDENDMSSSSLSSSATTLMGNTVLCRGGYRFVVKDIIKTIPFPVAIVDEIVDDTDVDDSDMFNFVGSTDAISDDKTKTRSKNVVSDEDEDEDDDIDDDDDDGIMTLTTPELIQRIMVGVQSVISNRLDDAVSKTQLSPLEKSILEDSGLIQGVDNDNGSSGNNGGGNGINPATIELLHAEEMAAVWDVFQSSLVDDIDAKDRRFSIAIMAAELTDMQNDIRQKIILTRNSEERLRIVLKEINHMVGMLNAKKIATQITDKVDETDKELKVGKPQLPKWALQIRKGTRIEYFWNEEYGWCNGEVIEEPVTVVDEILLTIRFNDGETHKLPLTAEDKIRWRLG